MSLYERFETVFALIAVYQEHENYGAHNYKDNGKIYIGQFSGEETCVPQHWKNKGHEEVIIAESISISDAAEFAQGERDPMAFIRSSDKCLEKENDNEGYHHTLISYSLDEMSEAEITRIHNIVSDAIELDNKYTDEDGNRYSQNSEYGSLIHSSSDENDISEKTFDWGMNVLRERGLINWDSMSRYTYCPVEMLIAPESTQEERQYSKLSRS